MWVVEKYGIGRSSLFLGVAAPSAIFMRLSNFYARSLIRFRIYGGRWEAPRFPRKRELKGVALWLTTLRDGEIQLSSGPRGITGISRPKAPKMKSTRLATKRARLLAPYLYLGKVKREDRKRKKTFSREKFLTGGVKRKTSLEVSSHKNAPR